MEGFDQKVINNWLKREYMKDLIDEEQNMGLMYSLAENYKDNDSLGDLFLTNIGLSYERILWLRIQIKNY
mgnify:CR=1 FL=1